MNSSSYFITSIEITLKNKADNKNYETETEG